jgi:hypothetical protein
MLTNQPDLSTTFPAGEGDVLQAIPADSCVPFRAIGTNNGCQTQARSLGCHGWAFQAKSALAITEFRGPHVAFSTNRVVAKCRISRPAWART